MRRMRCKYCITNSHLENATSGLRRRVALVRTNVSEERIASIIMVERIRVSSK
jgi:hypothetical protein